MARGRRHYWRVGPEDNLKTRKMEAVFNSRASIPKTQLAATDASCSSVGGLRGIGSVLVDFLFFNIFLLFGGFQILSFFI